MVPRLVAQGGGMQAAPGYIMPLNNSPPGIHERPDNVQIAGHVVVAEKPAMIRLTALLSWRSELFRASRGKMPGKNFASTKRPNDAADTHSLTVAEDLAGRNTSSSSRSRSRSHRLLENHRAQTLEG